MSYRRAWTCCAFIALAGCTPSPARTSSDTGTPATSASHPDTDASGDPAIKQLARLSSARLDAKQPEVSQYLLRFFRDECSKDDGLPFDQVCHHYPEDAGTDDPSPWPDLMLGLSGDRIVSAVLFDPAQHLGGTWACAPVKGLGQVRACTPTDITSPQRAEWLQRWSAYLNAAD